MMAGPASADACYTWNRTLRDGMSGEDVRQLQIRVAGWTASGEVLSIDGEYGPRTAAAVGRFQTAYGLSSDGVAGPQTFNQIYALQDDDCSPIHFTFAEVTQSSTCGSQASLQGGAVPAAQVRQNLIRSMWRAEALRRQLGDAPLIVTSGFRSVACNQQVGGSAGSRHTYGDALDFTGTPSLCAIARQARTAGFNEIIGPGAAGHSDHTHLADKPSRTWSAPNCF
ncbi:zinc D-Ala-D-Ala carboxypeptidase [Catenuloplanes atrovinosus]|uniref:Zinc D-Ala-D-Ala carboxypeptidase n=2 Tax=Catenuloplanes atrovinosus TaxID=137266 RepID=A0AAE3YQQ6_9ACTN|nr:zinc D-Ala-D-Ala carboxypeptidase [Catenuloplanes atrovinosus]